MKNVAGMVRVGGVALAVGAIVRERGTAATAPLTGPEMVAASATSGLAPGLAATQVWERRGDDDRGLAVTPCGLPSSDVWLVGGGGGPSRIERVIVGNPGANAVSVSFEVFGATGPVASAQNRSVSIAPRSRAVVSLDALAPEEPSPSVHVVATGGVVSAVLDDAWIDGATARGVDDATASAPPSNDQVIAGLDVSGAAMVRLVNPGAAEALVQVRLLLPKGPSQPAELRAVRVPAGGVTDVALDLAAGPTGLHLTADRPIVAGAYVERRMTTGPDRMGDFGWAPATRPVNGLAGLMLPGLSASGSASSLLLAGGSRGGKVVVHVVTGGADKAHPGPQTSTGQSRSEPGRTVWLKICRSALFNPESFMSKKIRVEADICAPKPVPPNGFTITTGNGQKRSLERGSHTRSKKNPGKRPHQG